MRRMGVEAGGVLLSRRFAAYHMDVITVNCFVGIARCNQSTFSHRPQEVTCSKILCAASVQ